MAAAQTLVPVLSTDNITVGDPITYALRIPLEQGLPSIDIHLAQFVDPKERELTVLTQNMDLQSGELVYQSTFTTFQTGGFKIKGFPLYNYQVQEVGIYVRSVLPENPSMDLKALKGPYQTFSWLWIPLIIGFFALIALAVWAWKKYKQRPVPVETRPEPGRTPLDIWEAYRDYFANLDLNAVADWRLFYFESSQKLKEAYFDIHRIDIRDLTTYEISYKDFETLPDTKETLLAALAAADRVKFAKHASTVEEADSYLLQIGNLVESLKPEDSSSSPMPQ
jgi:hypothetical protein